MTYLIKRLSYNIKKVFVKEPATTDWMEAWLIATVRKGAKQVLAKEITIQQLVTMEQVKWKEKFPRATPESLESLKDLLDDALIKEIKNAS